MTMIANARRFLLGLIGVVFVAMQILNYNALEGCEQFLMQAAGGGGRGIAVNGVAAGGPSSTLAHYLNRFVVPGNGRRGTRGSVATGSDTDDQQHISDRGRSLSSSSSSSSVSFDLSKLRL